MHHSTGVCRQHLGAGWVEENPQQENIDFAGKPLLPRAICKTRMGADGECIYVPFDSDVILDEASHYGVPKTSSPALVIDGGQTVGLH